MITASRQLLLRIYAVSVAQLLASAAVIGLVGWLTFKPPVRFGFVNDAQYIAQDLAEHRDDPAALTAELTRVRHITDARASVYTIDGRLIASNVSPPLPRLGDAERAVLRSAGRFIGEGPPPHRLAFALDASDPERGYTIVSREPPPRPPPDRTLWALAIALVAAAIAAFVLARSLVKPLRALTDAARKLGAGDLTVRVHSSRGDEFGELADAFDDMAERITVLLRSQQLLLANVSHELRTPLARIRVALDIAAEGDAETARESLGEITEDLAELERLVADVLQTAKLDLARGRAGGDLPTARFEHIEADALLERVVARFHGMHPERRLEVRRPRKLPSLSGDATLLRRAIDNLLDNARAYSNDDTHIELAAEVEGGELVLSVRDWGIGIAAADLPQIATPFFRTDPSRARRTGGLGLGLSLARRIVEAHHGKLEIESELGRGTTVRLRIPLMKQEEKGAAPLTV